VLHKCSLYPCVALNYELHTTAMGNTYSSVNSNHPKESSIRVEPVPPQIESTSLSSSSSSSSHESNNSSAGSDDRGRQHYTSNDCHEGEEEYQVPIKKSSSRTECYRLSIFKRKSDPLTILGTPTKSPGVLPRLSSFSNCVTPSALGENAHRDDDDDNSNHESSSSSAFNNSNNALLGCVTSPLGSRTSSWSNLLENELAYTQQELDMIDGDEPTRESNLYPSQIGGPRQFWIVTTAALPWMTGTAVNPLLRAAYLSQCNRPYAHGISTVTLVVPWLESADDRVALYGHSWREATPDYQASYIRQWLAEAAGLPLEASVELGGIQIQWYPARYHAGLSSIFAMGDLCQLIPDCNDENDETLQKRIICIQEEPEHVNFYRAPGRLSWRDKFDHVVGIIHTNYKAYASSHYSGLVTAPLIGAMSSLMVRAYCDKVVKLSPVLQSYAPEKEIVSNVHGIRCEFFTAKKCTGNKVYYIGKLLWAKGLDKMIDMQTAYRKMTGEYFEMDIFGSGPQQQEIERAFLQPYGASQKRTGYLPPISPREWRRQPIPANFLGRKDHANLGEAYKVFVNPSITEVLCTTTAESIAMGKWVIVPSHPSNIFFTQFPNCLQYSSKSEFCQLLQYALSHPPISLDKDMQYPLTWEAATDRFLQSACISKRDAKRRDRIGKTELDEKIAKFHYELGKGPRGDVIRKVLGGGPVAEQYQYEQVASPTKLSYS
jgi:digalactosyldiacylglycerol synthase